MILVCVFVCACACVCVCVRVLTGRDKNTRDSSARCRTTMARDRAEEVCTGFVCQQARRRAICIERAVIDRPMGSEHRQGIELIGEIFPTTCMSRVSNSACVVDPMYVTHAQQHDGHVRRSTETEGMGEIHRTPTCLAPSPQGGRGVHTVLVRVLGSVLKSCMSRMSVSRASPPPPPLPPPPPPNIHKKELGKDSVVLNIGA